MADVEQKIKPKKRYVALVGINFDGLKGKPRVEVGGVIPPNVPDSEIKELLAAGQIEEFAGEA